MCINYARFSFSITKLVMVTKWATIAVPFFFINILLYVKYVESKLFLFLEMYLLVYCCNPFQYVLIIHIKSSVNMYRVAK